MEVDWDFFSFFLKKRSFVYVHVVDTFKTETERALMQQSKCMTWVKLAHLPET